MRFKQILSAAMLCSISVLACAGAAFTDTTGIPEQADMFPTLRITAMRSAGRAKAGSSRALLQPHLSQTGP